jgi:hypothetical protein
VRFVPWLIGIALAAYSIRESIPFNRKFMRFFLITLRSTQPTEVARLTRDGPLKQIVYVASFEERAFRDRYINAAAWRLRAMWLISIAGPVIILYLSVVQLSKFSYFQ